jgi:ATP-dependent DNA helicase RecG
VALARRRAAPASDRTLARRPVADGILAAFDARLPFRLTRGQQDVAERLAAEMATETPMHRLLQGEVGSGKTVVALRAMLAAVDGGGQAALLAPTEVLAQQHYRSMRAMMGDLADGGMLSFEDGVAAPAVATKVVLLTGSLGTADRRRALADIATGEAGIVVGTHALIQEGVEFHDLALVVVDEQHRFGVEQRDALRAKGQHPPHVLVMTATPIPRTVAMTVFGDLEVSTLRELPAGRAPITTHVVEAWKPAWVERTWARLAEEAHAGRQAYVVCPRIGDPDERPGEPGTDEGATGEAVEDSDGSAPVVGDEQPAPSASVYAVHALLAEHPALAGVGIGMLHGRMTPEDKDRTMRAFAAGELDVLVATTVIEVGVDVANATVMVIMDADRFGISQLHQLRGRVGRGGEPGLCLLMTATEVEGALERLRCVAATTDGFELARLDLRQRREGDIAGAAQSGRSSLRYLGVIDDEDIIVAAREDAVGFVAADPELVEHPALAAAVQRLADEDRDAFLERG